MIRGALNPCVGAETAEICRRSYTCCSGRFKGEFGIWFWQHFPRGVELFLQEKHAKSVSAGDLSTPILGGLPEAGAKQTERTQSCGLFLSVEIARSISLSDPLAALLLMKDVYPGYTDTAWNPSGLPESLGPIHGGPQGPGPPCKITAPPTHTHTNCQLPMVDRWQS